jgi:hypothetical protein
MPTINELSSADTLQGSDQTVIYSSANGDARKVSMTTLATFMESAVTEQTDFQTQYSATNASGFSVTIAPIVSGGDVYLLLTPTGAFAAGTIVLPPVAACIDGQEVLMNTTQAVTTLTVSGNGATAVNGAPTTLAANAFFRLRFDGVFKSWYRIG